ncbi:MAG: hydrogenase formation protein HypD [Sulfolobales archaeon]
MKAEDLDSSWGYINYIEKIFRRDRDLARRIIDMIRSLSDRIRKDYGEDHRIKIMNFCGTHEWSIVRYGLRSLVPGNIELVAGPGCPVCVTPSYYIEKAIELSLQGTRVYTYGDVFRLRTLRPVEKSYSLEEAKALGADVRVVSSFTDAIIDASRQRRDSVFLAVGFETIAPGYSRLMISEKIPENLSILSLVKLTPPAMFYSLEILQEKPTEPPIAGVIAPGHVSTIVGAKAWTPVAENFEIPVVVAGFEPIDVLAAIAEILRRYVRREYGVYIEYERALSWHGDLGAQSAIYKTFKASDDAWRGIGFIPYSGLRIRREYKMYDALERHSIEDLKPEKWSYDLPKACRCAEVVLGKAKPIDCPLFMRACTPEKPYGPCMVSMEGACAIWARYSFQSR